jgi:hypothetical protein
MVNPIVNLSLLRFQKQAREMYSDLCPSIRIFKISSGVHVPIINLSIIQRLNNNSIYLFSY